jgi:hypothetical protein
MDRTEVRRHDSSSCPWPLHATGSIRSDGAAECSRCERDGWRSVSVHGSSMGRHDARWSRRSAKLDPAADNSDVSAVIRGDGGSGRVGWSRSGSGNSRWGLVSSFPAMRGVGRRITATLGSFVAFANHCDFGVEDISGSGSNARSKELRQSRIAVGNCAIDRAGRCRVGVCSPPPATIVASELESRYSLMTLGECSFVSFGLFIRLWGGECIVAPGGVGSDVVDACGR